MSEDSNIPLQEGMKPSQVLKAQACAVNKELITATGDQHRRCHLRHHVRLRAEPPPQTNSKQMSSSRSPHHQQIRAKVVVDSKMWRSCSEVERRSGRGRERGREREGERERERGGGGMQAFFLDSGKRSSGGTGVFLPQTNLPTKTNKKPACAPVLLPSRVVQALKLNVHSLGVQISPKSYDTKDKSATTLVECKMGKSRNGGKNDTERDRVVSPTRSSSSPPDIFLPKEWTY